MGARRAHHIRPRRRRPRLERVTKWWGHRPQAHAQIKVAQQVHCGGDGGTSKCLHQRWKPKHAHRVSGTREGAFAKISAWHKKKACEVANSYELTSEDYAKRCEHCGLWCGSMLWLSSADVQSVPVRIKSPGHTSFAWRFIDGKVDFINAINSRLRNFFHTLIGVCV